MSTIKRSIAVKPAPIVRENGYVRHPNMDDWTRNHEQGGDGSGWSGEWGYRVTRVTNSTDIRPGIAMDKERADQLINNGWTVTVLSKG